MIIGAVSGIGVLAVIIITVTCLLVLCCCQKRKRSYNISYQPRNAIALNFRQTIKESRQSSSSSMQSHEIQETANSVDLDHSTMKRSETQSMTLDTDSECLEEEDTEAKAAIKDKQVCTLYYCGNWQV